MIPVAQIFKMFYNVGSRCVGEFFPVEIDGPIYYRCFTIHRRYGHMFKVNGGTMFKHCLSGTILVTLLFAAPALWAQGKLPVKRIKPVRPSPTILRPSIPSAVQNKAVILPKQQKPWSYIHPIPKHELQARIERLLRLQQTNQNYIAQQLAKNPPVLGEPVKTQSAKLVYKGVELDVLQQGEKVIMGGAYDAQGRQVTTIHSSQENANPIPMQQAEVSLPGYDINMVIFIVRSPAKDKLAHAQTRIIVYYPALNKIDISHN